MANYIPKKNCRFCADKIETIDYKDVKMLQKYQTNYGKIESRKMSGTCPRHQRKLANALKRARMMAMLPFTTR
ncbi:MAG: 30S ribosomal protein S18, small subunit ribosomal protein S18 [candidate division CPR2 bacterium GW2011_GWC1_39_9]|uniref:Small ribosomal subunit protein bS18 n=1 Tax=candidate division CPR2 bacterium GW2011_GWC2_39_10 TaxID=1618345 RepID=A0A0G0LVX7_UNCC2|nr:MAG: 30S ribosomal protein S18 [candidate division CPR2 bacterium GW2011_GWC2_39_10]KKR33604.1 MAG: 30S ribosomal protein S18, small subunit ribosomal protein S18 [candidate division CPR2 bacterium GW2011_GWC1_39_9]